MRRIFPLLAAVAALSGCATGSGNVTLNDVMRVAHEVGGVATDLMLPVSEEKALGDKTAGEIEAKYKVSSDAELTRYVDGVGQRAAKASADPYGWAFTFKVIDEPKTVNAFAIPGARIYVFSGLIKTAKDEAQLAGVLAHEVGHVTKRHLAKRMVKQYGLQSLSDAALGKDANVLAQIGTALVAEGLLLKNSRDDEAEADAVGVVTTSKAGYDPKAMVEFFQTLKAGEGNVPDFMAYLSDHPLTADRIRALDADIAAKKLTGAGRSTPTYQAMQKRIP
ncbi:MAG TPA: M48 family metallopeptidase [Myxococcales bacterium]|jgi:predicted Zn-dependent protease